MKGEEEKEGGEERGAASSEEKFVLTIPPFHPSPPISRSPPPPRVGPPRGEKQGRGAEASGAPPTPLRREKEMIFRKTSLRSFLHSSPPSPRRSAGSRGAGEAAGLPGGRQEGAGCPPPTPAAARARGAGAGAGAARPPPPLLASPEPVL